jgi:hypothetical protein
MNSPATFSSRSPRVASIDFLLETVLHSLDATQATLALNGTGLAWSTRPAPNSGAEYDFRYLHEFCE